MNALVYQERQSKMKLFKENLIILSHESMVRKPHPSIKTLFYGKKPKNRKNLKKLNVPKLSNISINRASKNKQKYNIPSIQSIINNSKNNEFLSLDENPNSSFAPKIIIRPNYQNYINHNSSSTLYKVKPSIGNISNNSTNYKNNGDNNNINLNKTNTKISNDNNESASIRSNPIEQKKPKDVKELYKEYIENVSLNKN
jgi:hypothetical protein